jgi:hypothetical protein
MGTAPRSEEVSDVLDYRREHSPHWRAIVAGAVATLAVQLVFFYLGSALGLSSFSGDRAETFSDSSIWLPIFFILLAGLVSSFIGGWVMGLFGRFFSRNDVYLNGGLTWALSAILIALGLATVAGLTSTVTQSGAQKAQASSAAPGQEKAAQQVGSVAYDRLNDQQFANFVAERARSFANKRDTPINVSAGPSKSDGSQNDRRGSSLKNIEDDYELQRFVSTATDMDKDAAKEFLKQEREAISQAALESQRRWEKEHAGEISKAETGRRSASNIAWVMTLTALASLAITLVGAAVGAGRVDKYEH